MSPGIMQASRLSTASKFHCSILNKCRTYLSSYAEHPSPTIYNNLDLILLAHFCLLQPFCSILLFCSSHSLTLGSYFSRSKDSFPRISLQTVTAKEMAIKALDKLFKGVLCITASTLNGLAFFIILLLQ